MSAKRPVSQRGAPTPINMEDIFGNPLGLDPDLVKMIESQGQSYRFINYKRLADMGGHHPTGWRPWKPSDEQRAKLSAQGLIFGNDVDGFVRRGDCVLAVRPKELNEKHKAYLRQQAQASKQANSAKAAAQRVREFIKEHGLDMNILEGQEAHGSFGSDDEDDNF